MDKPFSKRVPLPVEKEEVLSKDLILKSFPKKNLNAQMPNEEELHYLLERSVKQHRLFVEATLSSFVVDGDAENFSRLVTKSLSEFLNAERVSVWFFSENFSSMKCVDLYQLSADTHTSGYALDKDVFGDELESLLNNDNVVFNDPLADSRASGYTQTYLIPNKITSKLDALISHAGIKSGMLCVEHVNQPHVWTDEEIVFVNQFACLIGRTLSHKARKLTEIDLAESEEKFRFFTENIKDVIWTLDVESLMFTYVSPSVQRLRGFTPEEIMAKPMDYALTPEQADAVRKLLQSRMPAFLEDEKAHQHKYFTEEVLQPCKDGSFVWTEVITQYVRNSKTGRIEIYGVSRDISARKKAEDALRESEARLSRAELVAKSGHWEIHLDNQMIYGSEGAKKIYGLQGDSFRYDMIKQARLPEYSEAIDEKLQHLIKTGEPTGVEAKIRNFATGEIIDVKYYMEYDKQRRVIFGAIQDITEIRKKDIALKESDQKFKNLVWDMQIGVLLQGPKAEIFLSNPKALELLGLTEDQLLGKTSFDPDWNVIHEDGSDFPGNTHPVPTAIALKKEVKSIIMGVYRPSGDRVWLLVDAIPQLNRDGDIWQVICTFIDISKRVKAEQALRTTERFVSGVLDTISAHVAVLDESGKIIAVNQAWRRFAEMNATNLSNVSEGANYLAVCDKATASGSEEGALFAVGIRKVLTGEQKEFILEYSCHAPHEKRWFLCRITSFQSEGAKFIVVAHENITAPKLAEEETKVINKELAKLNSEKDKLFSIIAHDLRSPFHGLLGLTAVMAKNGHGLTVDQMTNFSGLLNDSATNLYKLIENLLEWAQMQRNAISFSAEKIDLRDACTLCIDSILSRAMMKGISITNEIPEGIKIFTDEKMVNTVLRNLLSNAVKFSNRKGEVIARARHIEDGKIEVSISDIGIGIPANIIGKLFTAGEKVHQKGTEDEPSTGLGLILCKEFVEKLGGTIWVESKDGEGSTFYFTIKAEKRN